MVPAVFTGLVQAVGLVEARVEGRLTIQCDFAPELAQGESICVSGVCLTVTRVDGQTFDVDVSPTTENLTNAGRWQPGARVNLERALAVGDRLGGHIVTGHVDGTGALVDRVPAGNSERLRFEAPARLAAHLVEQGSIAVDGVSLTLNEIQASTFWVTIIPQTAAKTTLADLARGDRVNLETDILGKYVERVLAVRSGAAGALGR